MQDNPHFTQSRCRQGQRVEGRDSRASCSEAPTPIPDQAATPSRTCTRPHPIFKSTPRSGPGDHKHIPEEVVCRDTGRVNTLRCAAQSPTTRRLVQRRLRRYSSSTTHVACGDSKTWAVRNPTTRRFSPRYVARASSLTTYVACRDAETSAARSPTTQRPIHRYVGRAGSSSGYVALGDIKTTMAQNFAARRLVSLLQQAARDHE